MSELLYHREGNKNITRMLPKIIDDTFNTVVVRMKVRFSFYIEDADVCGFIPNRLGLTIHYCKSISLYKRLINYSHYCKSISLYKRLINYSFCSQNCLIHSEKYQSWSYWYALYRLCQ